jgi:hypothetical protein
MRITTTQPLFAWESLEDSPSLHTVRELLAALPDAKLLHSLHRSRGKGRDDYPVPVLWGTLVLSIALRHSSVEACLGELARNRALRELIGMASEAQVPKKWNMSRFLDVLGREPHLTLLHEVFDTMIGRLGEVVADLGRDAAGDSSGLNARRHAEKKNKNKNPSQLPEPTGGRKEYTDEAGNVTKVVEWFGYKFHWLVDVKHEVALSYFGSRNPPSIHSAIANRSTESLHELTGGVGPQATSLAIPYRRPTPTALPVRHTIRGA